MGKKLIIAGSRSINDYELLEETIEQSGFLEENIDCLISGGARGVDTLAEKFAEDRGYEIEVFNVTQEDYNEHGNYAPIKRNEEMAKEGDMLVALREEESAGTENMVKQAKKHNVRIHERVKGRNQKSLDSF